MNALYMLAHIVNILERNEEQNKAEYEVECAADLNLVVNLITFWIKIQIYCHFLAETTEIREAFIYWILPAIAKKKGYTIITRMPI